MSDLIPVNIVIADRNYRLRIEPKDEEMVRKTAGLINDKITEFKTNLAGKDMQDYISMALIWFATQNAQQVQDQMLSQDLVEGFERLDQMMDRGLAGIPKP